MDIFAGTCMTYPDQAVVTPAAGARMVGAVRWMRWDGTTMQKLDDLTSDPSLANSDRGGFAVAGLAIGDAVQAPERAGPELLVTTLAGGLFVFALGANTIGSQLQHVWVPGSLGAYNSILVEDLDFDFKNEVYIAGSQGLWKWRQK